MLYETRKNITGLLIKSNREKLGLKQEYLCKGICSISYLSKIEKGNIVPSEDINLLEEAKKINYTAYVINQIGYIK
ncbi:helix-turn-helix transcriptional regulator [Alkaliphilus sp. MSJ-5]|uniref:Helix-turn-helix transcriptional regulator n=1 Tax=Alkaliphilus flagellatus TaxID=2841507 RepID=A0ABS6FYM6_9FIRM|nr:helix-turn-helix transcriptional regulator [Alkaliphilus flagellatus]